MPLTRAQKRLIEEKVKSLQTPQEIRRFLEKACEANFEPGLSLEVFEGLVDKMDADTIQYLRDRLTARNSAAGLARLQKIINKDPDRR